MIEVISADKEREARIVANYEQAYQVIPEVFFKNNLYQIDCQINGHEFQPLIDTGAAISVISEELAEKCGLTDLIDYRVSGELMGVGRQKVTGRIWLVDAIINDHAVPISLTVCKNFDMGMLIGLDLLNAHGCQIDLQRKVLTISGIEVKMYVNE